MYSGDYKKGAESTERSSKMADDGMTTGGCSGWYLVFFLFFLLAWGGNGWGGFSGGNAANAALTRAELYDGFNNQTVVRKLDGINQGLCDGFYAQNTTMLQGMNNIGRDLCQGFAAVNAGINQARFDAQQCCCNTLRAIEGINYNNAKNTCDIVRAIEKDGDATRALIVSNTIQDLRDRLTSKDQELQSANFQISQISQTNNIVNAVKPCPQPAYVVGNPYLPYGYEYGYGYNHNCRCGCNGQ